MALQFVSHKFSSLIFCEYLTTSAHKSSIVVSVLISRSTVLEVYCYSMFATDTPQMGSRRLYPLLWVIWRASYFSWLTLVLPAQLKLVPWKCHPLSSHLGASSSVAAGRCVTASPPPLVVDDPVYLGCVQWKCFALNNRRCDLRNIFTRFCRPSTFLHMFPQETPLVPQEDLPAFHTEHLHVYIQLYFSNCWFFRCSCGLWRASLLYIYIYIYIYIYLFIFIYANGHSVL